MHRSRTSRACLALAAAVASTVCLTPGEARAEGISGGLIFLITGAMAGDASLAAGGLVTGIGASVAAGQGRYARGWYVAACVLGGLNTIAAIAWSYPAFEGIGDFYAGFSLGHASAAVVNLVPATIGLVRGPEAPMPLMVPVAVGGVDAGGQRWWGAGVQLTHF